MDNDNIRQQKIYENIWKYRPQLKPEVPVWQALVHGRVRQEDLQMAAKIASGSLRTDSLVQALVASFLRHGWSGAINFNLWNILNLITYD